MPESSKEAEIPCEMIATDVVSKLFKIDQHESRKQQRKHSDDENGFKKKRIRTVENAEAQPLLLGGGALTTVDKKPAAVAAEHPSPTIETIDTPPKWDSVVPQVFRRILSDAPVKQLFACTDDEHSPVQQNTEKKALLTRDELPLSSSEMLSNNLLDTSHITAHGLLVKAQKYAELHGLPFTDIWRDLRYGILYHIIQGLSDSIASMAPPVTDNIKLTSGVSFVQASESYQQGVSPQLAPLPHVVFRPPDLRVLPISHAAVQEIIGIISKQAVPAAVMPLKEENTMKSYLLWPGQREALLQQNGGTTSNIQGTGDLPSLLRDRSFVCLHYHIGTNPLNSFVVAPSNSLAASNMQIAVMVRKGVGGTCPLKNAEKQMLGGSLTALLDESLIEKQVASTATDSQADAVRMLDILANNHPALGGMQASNDYNGNNTEDLRFMLTGNGGIMPSVETLHQKSNATGEVEEPEYVRMSLHTLSCRLEMYVEGSTWAKMSAEHQSVLLTLIRQVEHNLLTILAAHNHARLKAYIESLKVAVVQKPASHVVSLLNLEEVKVTTDDDFNNHNLNAAVTPMSSSHNTGENYQSFTFEKNGAQRLSFDAAVVQAAACMMAAPTCGISLPHIVGHFPWPYYLISTRDCFTYELLPMKTTIELPTGRTFACTRWYFKPNETPPDNYSKVIQELGVNKISGAASKRPYDSISNKDGMVEDTTSPEDEAPEMSETGISTAALLPVGVTTYHGIFNEEELQNIEKSCDKVDNAAREGRLPDSCFHTTYKGSGGLKRTKFFFGARYMWTRDQLMEADAKVAAGVRVDVPSVPGWMSSLVEGPLVKAEVVSEGFVNSVALNMYHDGSEGIQSHYDDQQRFDRPIVSLRLFSDSRLSFGGSLYGYTNASFFIPMERGCCTVMERHGYAAHGLKHCVRPSDMAGKSAGMILRRINPTALREAQDHNLQETTSWMECLTLEGHSRRAEQLYTQWMAQAAASAAGYGGNPAHISKPVRRVMESMLDRVELSLQKEDDEAGVIRLLCAHTVKRVETAGRWGLDLDSEGACEVFSLLDGMVSWCERAGRAASAASGTVGTGTMPLMSRLMRETTEANTSLSLEGRENKQAMGRLLHFNTEGKQQHATNCEQTSLAQAQRNSNMQHHLPQATAAANLQLARIVTAVVCSKEDLPRGSLLPEVAAAVKTITTHLKLEEGLPALRQWLTLFATRAAPQQQQLATPPNWPFVLTPMQFQAASWVVYTVLCKQGQVVTSGHI